VKVLDANTGKQRTTLNIEKAAKLRTVEVRLTFKIFHKSHLDPVTKKPRNGRTGASKGIA
jgi:hypothetical protein